MTRASSLMKYFNVALLALGTLYLAIWPHELGHSLAAAHFGCKEHWWQTDAERRWSYRLKVWKQTEGGDYLLG